MRLSTPQLHAAWLDVFGGDVITHSDAAKKPLDVDLKFPLPPRIRIYTYNLVFGGKARPDEYKVVTRVPGQTVGEYASFNHEDGRLTLLTGYSNDLDVFVFWDAYLHPKFKWAGNMQVKKDAVLAGVADGLAEHRRPLKGLSATEVVLISRPRRLGLALQQRVSTTGGIPS